MFQLLRVHNFHNYDASTIQEADVSLAMAIQGIEVAKESSNIVIMEDNFMLIVEEVQGGRLIYYKYKNSSNSSRPLDYALSRLQS